VRTSLSNTQGVVERRRHELDGFDFDAFRYQIDTALFFLNPLIDEFRRHYKEISARQSVDEITNKRRYEKGQWENQSRHAWTALCDKMVFVHLNKLIAFGELNADQFRNDPKDWENTLLTLKFLDPIDLAAQLLRAGNPRSRQR
jgi:hypothetical protein